MGFTIGFGGSSVAASQANPFVNDAALILGQSNTSGGVSGIDTYPSAVATGGAGLPQGGDTGTASSTNPQTLTGVLGSLVNNTTFWLAAGALVTLLVILHKRK